MEQSDLIVRLHDENFIELANLASEAAREAGQYILKMRSQDHFVKRKIGGNTAASQVVTEVDEMSQSIILSHLNKSCRTFDLGILTEEAEDNNTRFEKDYFWCIDPLDGTLPYIEGTDGFAVSIALVSREGRALIGVVYDPTNDVLYKAVVGNGCTRNDEKWDIAFNKNSFLFISDRSFKELSSYNASFKSVKEIVHSERNELIRERHYGGAVMNAIWVLEYAPACYFKLPKIEKGGGSLWDYAATACIFSEFGVAPTTCSGEILDLNKANSTFMNIDGVVYCSQSNFHQKLLLSIK